MTPPTALTPTDLEPWHTYIVNVSGGKDSTALLLWALDHLPHDRLRFLHCLTGAEWPQTPTYLTYLEDALDISIHCIRAGDRPIPLRRDGQPRADALTAPHLRTLTDLIRARGMWPSAKSRFCTLYLKRWPARLYAAQLPDPIQLVGLRADESFSRASRPPITYDRYRALSSVHLPPAAPLAAPLLTWSEADVFDYLAAHNIEPNPIYQHVSRCSCLVCPLSPIAQIVTVCRLYPHLLAPWALLEHDLNHTWHPRYSITATLATLKRNPNITKPPPINQRQLPLPTPHAPDTT